jgi:tetratricopeptide (TPR) repeat protein/DNA-binding CsgD family transcriptional regulator
MAPPPAINLHQRAICLQQELASGEAEKRIHLLLQLWDVQDDLGHHNEAMSTAHEALQLAGELDDRYSRAMAERYIAITHKQLGEFSEAAKHFRGAERGFKAIGSTLEATHALFGLGLVYQMKGDQQNAERQFRRCLKQYEQLGDRKWVAKCQSAIGRSAWTRGDNAEAMKRIEAALTVMKEMGSRVEMGIQMNQLAVIHGTRGDYTEALRYLLEARDLFHNQQRRDLVLYTMINIGSLYLHTGVSERAAEIFQECLVCADEIEAVTVKISVLKFLGHCSGEHEDGLHYLYHALELADMQDDRDNSILLHCDIGLRLLYLGDSSEASRHAKQAAALLANDSPARYQAAVWKLMGKIERMLGKHSRAIGLLKDAVNSYRVAENRDGERMALSELALAYEQSGDIASAFEHYKAYHVLEAELIGSGPQHSIEQLITQRELQKIQHEREQLRVDREQLHEALQQKETELTSMALHLVQKNEALEKIRSEVSRMVDAATGDAKGMLRQLVVTIRQSAGSDEQWAMFEKQFQHVHPQFVDMLRRQAPDLTVAESRVTALLRLQLNTKEIASLLHVSTRAVEKHRLNIRRKLGVEGKIALPEYLASLA